MAVTRSPTATPTAADGPSGSTLSTVGAPWSFPATWMPSHAAPGTGLDGAHIAATLATLMISTPAEPRLQMPTSWPSALTIGAPSGVACGQPSSVRWPSALTVTLAAVGVAPRTVTASPPAAAGPIPYEVVTAA